MFQGTDIHDFCKVQPHYTVENMMSNFTITVLNKHDTGGWPPGPLNLSQLFVHLFLNTADSQRRITSWVLKK